MIKLKKSICILIIAVIAVFVYCNRVEAISVSNVGDQISIGFIRKGVNSIKLVDTEWLYCIQHPGTFRSSKYNLYTVKYKITINGSKATNVTNGNSTTNKFNAIMAYILAKDGYERGYGSSSSNTTVRQKAVWYYWNTWLSNNASGLGIDYSSWKNPNNNGKSSLNTAAENWYSSSSSSSASISGNSTASYDLDDEGKRYIKL